MTRILQSEPWAPGAKKLSGPYNGGPVKDLLHATIAPANVVPDYGGQSMAPHTTYIWDSIRKRLSGVQHYQFNQFAKALRNTPGGVETNRDSVIQHELAGYLGSSTPKGEFDILSAPDTYWEQVADRIGPVIQSWNIPNVSPRDWSTKGRLSLSAWDNFSGLCAHVHVPENDHWDLPIPPAALAVLQKKIWISTPVPITSPKPVPVPTPVKAPLFPLFSGHYFGRLNKTEPKCHSGYYSATDRNYIRMFQKQLRVRGWTIDVDGLFGPGTASTVHEFQTRKRLGVDDRVGPITWRAIWESK